MIPISSFPVPATLARPLTMQQLRRELMAVYVRTMLRREMAVRYLVNLAAVGLLILLGAFLIQLASVLGHPLVLSARDAEIGWIVSVAIAAASTLVTGLSWWHARSEWLRTELSAIQLRLELDESAEREDGVPE